MGEKSGEKQDSSIDKLCEIFSKIIEQPRVTPEIVKYALEPNPVKLSGPENYVSWARHTKLILGSHGYDNLLFATDGETEKKGEMENKQINDRVLVWLLGSMESKIREQVETFETVAEVWSALETQFSGKSNKMQATRAMHELLHLKQDTKSVTEYAGEMKRLYRDLHYYHPFEPVDKKDLAIHHSWFQSLVSKLFLDGLNQDFDLRRQLIFSMPEWPSLDDIVSSIREEETRIKSHPKVDVGAVDARAALSMKGGRTNNTSFNYERKKPVCDHCGDEGHIKAKCFKLHGYPPGWKKGRSQLGGAQSGKWRQANHTEPERKLPEVDVQALEEYKSKLNISEGLSSAQGSSTADSSFHASSQGAKDRENSWDWDCA